MKTRNKVLIGGAVVVIAYLLMNRNKNKSNLTVIESGTGSGSANAPLPSSNLDLPSGMDLPNLTPSINVPTEVAIEKSIKLKPLPAVVESKPVDTETALNNSLIIPIPKVTVPIAEVQEQTPIQAPVFTPALPRVAPSISESVEAPSIAPSVDMELKTPYSQYVKEMIPVYEAGYNKGKAVNTSNVELQMY